MFKIAGSTAILIFSRTALQEAAVKTFDKPSGKSGNALIAGCLIRKTVRTARSTGLPFFLHYDRPCKTTAFGERLADAIESVFALGFSRVIAIGTDSPELGGGTLLDAWRKLNDHPLVLGPAADGGVYLIGLDRKAWRRDRFAALPWQTGGLQQAWQLQEAGPVWLEMLSDVDQSVDFQHLLHRLDPSSSLFRCLVSILASYTYAPVLQRFPIPAFSGFHATDSLRGPPR